MPFAGGGVSVFNSWPARMPPHVQVCSVELPGRDSLINERPHTDFASLIVALEEAVAPILDRPVVLFGHSLGALMGFELCRALRRSGRQQPTLLIVSGHGAPHLATQRKPIHRLPRRRFVREMRKLEGTPQAVLESPELLELVLPILRADFKLHHSYEFVPGEPLDLPLLAFGGAEDPEVARSELVAWREHTRGGFGVRIFTGGHFFLLREQQRFLETLADLLPAATPAAHGRILGAESG